MMIRKRRRPRHITAGMLTPGEVAERLLVHVKTVYRYIREGRFEGVEQTGGGEWRIPESEVEAWRPLPRTQGDSR